MRRSQAVFQSTLPSQGATDYVQMYAESLAFQSTLPSQGATQCFINFFELIFYFNPRSPHRERRHAQNKNRQFNRVSIHAPLTGSDERSETTTRRDSLFQSTLPSQGATPETKTQVAPQNISIHAPLTGSDGILATSTGQAKHFNPRSPHRERPPVHIRARIVAVISIHAPLTGSDLVVSLKPWIVPIFQSTLPSQGATSIVQMMILRLSFQSTLPSQGATCLVVLYQ